jgi:hypothetical protein
MPRLGTPPHIAKAWARIEEHLLSLQQVGAQSTARLQHSLAWATWSFTRSPSIIAQFWLQSN